jgi:hypothetical protein
MTHLKEKYAIPGNLAQLDRDSQREAMREWFLSSFEDPANNCPVESGEFIFIWGGPHEPHDELASVFSGVVDDDIIEELADELNNQCPEWSGIPTDDEAEEREATRILDDAEWALRQIELLLDHGRQPLAVEESLHRMSYSHCITILEAYLSETLISKSLDATVANKIIAHCDDLCELISTRDLARDPNSAHDKMRKHLRGTMWHNLPKIQHYFKGAFGDFPRPPPELHKAIATRHDLVHRNGRSLDGSRHQIYPNDVRKLVAVVRTFINAVELQCANNLKLNVTSL